MQSCKAGMLNLVLCSISVGPFYIPFWKSCRNIHNCFPEKGVKICCSIFAALCVGFSSL
uniref:Uncharacterized protein n=1 Tax=Rhizophora mucronata TaxID=61149 RepID=A0A2P2PYL9_RHIMU